MTLSESSKRKLLVIARATLEAVMSGHERPSHEIHDKKLEEAAGAFVTIRRKDSLRGCMGCFESKSSVYEVVQEMALAAALHDPRFPPLSRDELDEVSLEISVLSPLREIHSDQEITLGEHGILIQKEAHSGCFLPQVARETSWSREEFLGHCSRDKAGLGWDGWRKARLFVFTVEEFSESPAKPTP